MVSFQYMCNKFPALSHEKVHFSNLMKDAEFLKALKSVQKDEKCAFSNVVTNFLPNF